MNLNQNIYSLAQVLLGITVFWALWYFLSEKDQVYHVYSLLTLSSQTTYFTTIRAKTGAGDILESSSNGITVDTSPPEAQFTKVGETMTTNNNPESIVYQREPETMTASWNVSDQESTVSVVLWLSSYPGNNN